MLDVKSISVHYDQRQALREVSFQLQPGEILGVIGPNGAGKTTLVRALSGVLPLAAGHITVEGRDLSRMSEMERAQQMAVVPQARNLPGAFTVWEMVLLGRTPHLGWLGSLSPRDEEIAHQAMLRTDTLELADRRLGELSGGEQQRVLMARALAQSAPILLMDEPTTHLDLQYQVALMDLTRSLAEQEKLAVLVSLHDLNLVARYAHRVALLVGGVLQAIGTPAEVLTAERLSQVYHVPLQAIPVPGGPPVIVPE